MKTLLLSLSPRAIHPTAQYNIPKDLNPETHRCKELNSRIYNAIWGPGGADHEENALWNVESCNVIDALRRFSEPCCLHQPGRMLWLRRWMILMIEPTCSSKTSVFITNCTVSSQKTAFCTTTFIHLPCEIPNYFSLHAVYHSANLPGSCHGSGAFSFSCSTTTPLGPRPPHCWGFEITHRYTHTHTLTHTHRCTRWDSSGWVISPTQRPLPDNTQLSQETDIHAPCGIRIRNPNKRPIP